MKKIIFCILFSFISMGPSEPPIHHHPGQTAAIDKFYSTWFMPDEPNKSCCHNIDCYSAEIKKIGDHYEFLRREDHRWIPIPFNKIEQFQTNHIPRESPDGRNHVCAPTPILTNNQYDQNDKRVFCAVLGQGS